MRILIGLDGSPEAATAVEFVLALPLAPDDEVIVASVAEVPTGIVALAGPPAMLGWYDELRDAVTTHSRRVVDEATARLHGHGRISGAVVEGHPVDALLGVARERSVDLVAVGPRGRGRLETLVLGSVSQGLLDSAAASLLVARPIRRDLGTVLVAVDGSAGSRAAVRYLGGLPLPAGVTVVCASVVPSRGGPFGRAWPDEILPVVESSERAVAEEALDDAAGHLGSLGLDVRRELLAGRPKEEIVALAANVAADLIVVGARGLGALDQLVLGSVSRAIAKTAPCSVLVVRDR